MYGKNEAESLDWWRDANWAKWLSGPTPCASAAGWKRTCLIERYEVQVSLARKIARIQPVGLQRGVGPFLLAVTVQGLQMKIGIPVQNRSQNIVTMRAIPR
jgi:hypothetical protein